MVDDLKLAQSSASSGPHAATPARGLLGRFATHFADSPVSFDVVLPNGTLQHFGPAAASFHVTLKNARALRAVTSLDEGRFGDAYLAGDIDLTVEHLEHDAAAALRWLERKRERGRVGRIVMASAGD